MLRGSRSHESASLSGSYTGTPSGTLDFLVAVAPLPRTQTFRVAGWPQWLVPGRLSLSRGLRSRNPERDDY
jgi:hypothetical protein